MIKSAIVLASINITIAIVSLVAYEAWISKYGLAFIASSITYVLIFNITAYAASIIFFVIYMNIKSSSVSYFASIIAAICSLLDMYFGVSLAIDPRTYVSGFSDAWIENINTRQVALAQNSLKCCGFYKIGEIASDRCNISKTMPCQKRLVALFGSNIRIGGASLGFQGLSFAFVGIASFLEVKFDKEKGRRERRLLRLQNQP